MGLKMCLVFVTVGLVSFCGTARPMEPVSGDIEVFCDRVSHRISRLTTGACIEDVNHEIYGGIYSQMIFGESFEEGPDVGETLDGFSGYGGDWLIEDDHLTAEPSAGGKIVSAHEAFARGKVGVELFFADREAGNAGLIAKVDRPGKGADRFFGYEISLDPRSNALVLGRHRNNWEPLEQVACDVPVGRWVALAVEMEEASLRVRVAGELRLEYQDAGAPLASGRVGLRTWHKRVKMRNLWSRWKARGRSCRLGNSPTPHSWATSAACGRRLSAARRAAGTLSSGPTRSTAAGVRMSRLSPASGRSACPTAD